MSVAIAEIGACQFSPLVEPFSGEQLRKLKRLGGRLRDAGLIEFPRQRPEGFDILLWHSEAKTTGDFGGLIQDFAGLDEALSWTQRCLCENYRLRVDRAGRRPYRWALEKVLPNGGYVEIFVSGHDLFFSRLLPRSARYVANGASAHSPVALPAG